MTSTEDSARAGAEADDSAEAIGSRRVVGPDGSKRTIRSERNIRPEDGPTAADGTAASARRAELADYEAHRFGRPPENLPAFVPAPASRSMASDRVGIEVLDFSLRRDRARFVDVADGIYRADPHYVAPLRMHLMKFLDPVANPAFSNLEVRPIVAIRDGKPVGRMTAQIDRSYDAYHGTHAGFFGFFESIDDRDVAHTMMSSSLNWLKARGCREVFGPMNLTANHQMGLIVENFDRPAFVEEPYNPSYYPALFESFGFGKAKDLFVWWIDIRDGMNTDSRRRVKRVADRIRKREGVTVRQANMKRLDDEFENLFKLYVGAWERNWGFVPLSREEFDFLIRPMKDIVIPELVLFVEFEGRPVGFCATLPNIVEHLPQGGRLFPFGWVRLLGGLKKTKAGRLYTLGVLPEYRKRGLESIMFTETLERGQRLGFLAGEIGQTLEDNDLINRAIESMDGRMDRRYRIFGMTL